MLIDGLTVGSCSQQLPSLLSRRFLQLLVPDLKFLQTIIQAAMFLHARTWKDAVSMLKKRLEQRLSRFDIMHQNLKVNCSNINTNYLSLTVHSCTVHKSKYVILTLLGKKRTNKKFTMLLSTVENCNDTFWSVLQYHFQYHIRQLLWWTVIICHFVYSVTVTMKRPIKFSFLSTSIIVFIVEAVRTFSLYW